MFVCACVRGAEEVLSGATPLSPGVTSLWDINIVSRPSIVGTALERQDPDQERLLMKLVRDVV